MTPQEAYKKCLKEKRRIIELEQIISTDSEYSYYYAHYIIKGPWEQGENSISSNPECSYWYARDIIKGPWEKGEESISKDPENSYYYAHDVIKRPFQKSHSIVFNSDYKNRYVDFLKFINYDLNKISEWLI
jgi:hypothetical protein